MSKTVLKNKQGVVLSLDGSQVVVLDKDNADVALTTELATLRARINDLASVTGALKFKGVVNETVALPTENYVAGWTYKVGFGGTFAGQKCEVGDLIICVSDFDTEASDDDWQVIQANIDGAVTGPTEAVASNIAVFDNASGKVIADSGVAVSDIATLKAVKHSHENSEVLDELGESDGMLTFNGALVFNEEISCAVIKEGDAIPANLRENGIVFVVSE